VQPPRPVRKAICRISDIAGEFLDGQLFVTVNFRFAAKFFKKKCVNKRKDIANRAANARWMSITPSDGRAPFENYDKMYTVFSRKSSC